MKKVLLRSVFLLLIVNCSLQIARAQWVTIPDPNFVAYLQTTFPVCMNGNQMDTTCPDIVNATAVYCSEGNISDLTGIQYFDNLDTLNCSNNNLTVLPTLRIGLVWLNCGYNQLSNLPSLPAGLTWLECSFNHLTNLPALPAGLNVLNCNYNQLTNLPALPAGLNVLECSVNQLTNLPALPVGLTVLYCGNNQLTNLSVLPAGLTGLDCSYNQLTNLPALPAGLTGLYCSYNQLTNLPALPAALSVLYCFYNQLTNLPALPAGLTGLDCSANQLTVLPALPTGLTWLACSLNNLTVLPALPAGLNVLWCNGNQLTNLPALPAGLTQLYCYNNQLTNLPALPAGLPALDCENNQLTSLPALPDSLYRCAIGNNPITCLPQLKRIVNLDFTNTNITCLPNYGSVTTSNPPLQFVPLCDTFNSNNCNVLWNIAGNVFYDANNNCIKDTNDISVRNVNVKLSSGSNLLQQTFTGGEGFYSFDTDSFSVYSLSVDTSNIPFYVSCPANNLLHDTLSAVDSLSYSNDFAVQCKPGFDVAAWSIWASAFHPTRLTTINVAAGDLSNFYGVHCAAGVSGAVTVTVSGAVHYVSPAYGALTPTISGNTLTYNIADFGNVNFFTDFNFVEQTDTTAPLGSLVCITVSVTPTAGDNNPANNTLTQCYVVTSSYDPNEKQVYPLSDVDVNGDKWLTYTINFQNTGTDTAHNIYVDDTLNSNLDVSTFQLLAYSQQPLVQVKGNIVRFNFPNINLPDSNVNEPASHGYVQYKIKMKNNLSLGTQITNTAYIYFDFNAPVVTNTTTNTITNSTGISNIGHPSSDIRIFPNPATNEVTIVIDNLKDKTVLSLKNVLGQTLLTKEISSSTTTLDLSSFASGVYIIELNSAGMKVAKRLVKE